MYLDEYTPRCFDSRCEVRASCELWIDRNNEKARLRCNTLRHGNECHDDRCRKSLELLRGMM